MAALSVAAVTAALSSHEARAQSITPASGRWCGVATSAAGSSGRASLRVSADRRFVSEIEITTPETMHLSMAEQNGPTQVQIADLKWLYRSGRDQRRLDDPCRQGPICPLPCRSRTPCNNLRDTSRVLGHFKTSTSMTASYSASIVTYTGRGGQTRPTTKTVVGTLTLWPEQVAPCP
jgi:hypothetical protein